MIEGTGKRLTPGDVMVLVRKRDRFVHALSRSLKEKRIPVAGADRLSLPAHIAVKDMMALGRFLLQPEDDLSLAAVLRSPVFGLNEDMLFELAAKRGERSSLAEELRRQAPDDLFLAEIAAKLDAWANEAAFRPVFEFYSGVLGRDGVRQRMIARLGHEAGDILDEFLSFCLAEERTGLPGLEAFLATLESAGTRDQARDGPGPRRGPHHDGACRQGPGGAGGVPGRRRHRAVQRAASAAADAVRHERRLAGAISGAPPRTSPTAFPGQPRRASRKRADDEYRRLLYVGMTRAEDRLIVCGYHGKRARNPRTWHTIVSGALVGVPETEEQAHPVTGEAVHRFRSKILPAVAAEERDTAVGAQTLAPLPLFKPLPPDDDLPRPLSPSGASVLIEDTREPVVSARSPVLDGEEEPGFAMARGSAIHKLLQILPDMPEDEREAAARRYLGARRAGLAGGGARRRPGRRSRRFSARTVSRRSSRQNRAPKWRSWASSRCAAASGWFPARSTGWR